MELKQELKEYLLGFPQEYWLVPCSNSSRYNKVFSFYMVSRRRFRNDIFIND